MKKGIDYIGVGAGAMIFNDQGMLFLSKRSMLAKNEKGYWETPGGTVDFGETLEQAARREMLEEYGADIDIIEQWEAEDHIIPEDNQHWIAVTFLAKFKPGQEPRILEPHKCDAIGWFALDNLPAPLSIITKLDIKRYNEKYIRKNGEKKREIISAYRTSLIIFVLFLLFLGLMFAYLLIDRD